MVILKSNISLRMRVYTVKTEYISDKVHSAHLHICKIILYRYYTTAIIFQNLYWL
jgi:hypothetical protein